MRASGTLVFALAVLVNSIVCPGRIPQILRVFQASPHEIPGVHIPCETGKRKVNPVHTHLAVVAMGNFIIGREEGGYLLPIYDQELHYVKLEIESKNITILSEAEFAQFGLFARLPENTIWPNSWQRPKSPSPSTSTFDSRLSQLYISRRTKQKQHK